MSFTHEGALRRALYLLEKTVFTTHATAFTTWSEAQAKQQGIISYIPNIDHYRVLFPTIRNAQCVPTPDAYCIAGYLCSNAVIEKACERLATTKTILVYRLAFEEVWHRAQYKLRGQSPYTAALTPGEVAEVALPYVTVTESELQAMWDNTWQRAQEKYAAIIARTTATSQHTSTLTAEQVATMEAEATILGTLVFKLSAPVQQARQLLPLFYQAAVNKAQQPFPLPTA